MLAADEKIRVRLFGGMRLAKPDGQRVLLSGKRGSALIAYLVRSPSMTATRDKLSDLLWTETDNERSRNNLRQTLTMLRRDLSDVQPDLIRTHQDSVSLVPTTLDCDVDQFLSASDSSTDVELESALAHYTGPFLDGFFSGSAVFEEWSAAERERLLNQAIDVLERLARRSSGDKGIAYARRLLALEPTREASYRLEMELLAANGHRDGALRIYEACKAMLRRELGVEPSEETQAVHRAIIAPQRNVPGKPTDVDEFAFAPPERKTIGIATFANFTDQRNDELFARGLIQDIITTLSQQGDYVVVSRLPSDDVQFTTAEASRVGGERHVNYLLSGAIQRVVNRVRLNVHLIDTHNGQHVWSERFDGR